MKRCLYCYEPLNEGEELMHKRCAKKFFGNEEVPELGFDKGELVEMAKRLIKSQTTVTGVQPKLSLSATGVKGQKRLTIVGLLGDYICKPQTEEYKMMPEVEDLTMHLAECAKIDTVPHTLMKMADESLCYLTRRIDRKNGEKIAMEDMCQLTERMTEYKYKGSYESIGKKIAELSSQKSIDIVNFFDIVLFSWITGNNDMHLKNFSMYSPNGTDIKLTPAYDLLNVSIVNPEDKEEMALTLNGKRSNIRINDFIKAAATIGIEEKIVMKQVSKYERLMPKFREIIEKSFLDEEMKEKYIELLQRRIKMLE